MKHTELPIIVNPTENHLSSVVWLHGLGASANDFYSLLPLLSIDKKNNIKWIFPNAPKKPMTINNGMVMPSWFDIQTTEISKTYNKNDVEETRNQMTTILNQEFNALTKDQKKPKLCIAGFSQGGVIAIDVGLHWQKSQLSVLALSSFHPINTAQQNSNLNQVNMMLMHGINDQVIPIQKGKMTYDKLIKLNVNSQWRDYEMAHEINQQQLKDLGSYFNDFME